MSHNTPKIGTASQDRAGEMSPELNDLNDVSAASPASGESLQWNGAAWVPASLSAAGSEMIFIGDGASKNYYSSGSNPAIGVDVNFHDLAPINTIPGATINVEASPPIGENWITSVSIPAGTYLFESSLALSFSTTSTANHLYYNGATSLGLWTPFGSSDFEVGCVQSRPDSRPGQTSTRSRRKVHDKPSAVSSQSSNQPRTNQCILD